MTNYGIYYQSIVQLNVNIMPKKITRFQKFVMHNPFIQFFMFLFLNVKILSVVAFGHGGTRENKD